MSDDFMFREANDCEWNGPRPPVPGKESRRSKMSHKGEAASCESDSPIACLKWAKSLQNLLQDREGVALFKKYADAQGGLDADRVKFYFACEGLKQQVDPTKVKQIIGAIYKFLRKSELTVPDHLKKLIKAGLHGETALTPNIFNEMQKDVEQSINNHTYRAFIQSRTYVTYVNSNLDPYHLPSSSSSSEEGSKHISRSSTLPTLHEDSEFVNYDSDISCGAGGAPITLTKDALMATQMRRLEITPSRTSSYATYLSYNPVSRRDSELHSLSSGRTDSDTMSLSSMSTDSRTHVYRRHHASVERKLMKANVVDNPEAGSVAIIPRTQRIDVTKTQPSQEDFLKILLPKLERVQKEQEQKELLAKKLQEADLTHKTFAEALREKLFTEDKMNDQDILDQHVSRVWSDLTPIRSPGAVSPCSNPNKKRQLDLPNFGTMSSSVSLRHSKSTFENSSKKLSNKWPSMATDSGISLLSTDTIGKHKDQCTRYFYKSEPSSSTATPVSSVDPKHKMEEEMRKFSIGRAGLRPPSPTSPPPTIPAKPNQAQYQEFTTVVYNFCDEELPYRIKIHGSSTTTLRQFKDYLPKKGNYRFYFKTRCEDLDNAIIQEEITNDSEVLPLFEGKVMGTVKYIE